MENGGDLPEHALEWIARAVAGGARVRRAWRLTGGTSSEMHAVDVEDARGRIHPLVLRRILNRDWLAREPDLIDREAAALETAAVTGLVPAIVATDAAGELCDAPAILSERLDGALDFAPASLEPWLHHQAEALARIHDLTVSDIRFPHARRWFDAASAVPPSWTQERKAWRHIIAIARARPPASGDTFLHRDYHAGNVLWQDGRLTGVVDWVNACIGSRAVDLGHCRRNLAALFGVEAAQRFLAIYTSLTGYDHDPLGDIETLLDKNDSGLAGAVEIWRAFGRTDISVSVVRQRDDEYALQLARQTA